MRNMISTFNVQKNKLGTEKGQELKTKFEAQYMPQTREDSELLCTIAKMYYNPETGHSSMGYNPKDGIPTLPLDALPSFSTLKN